ncbi:hypothetical protein DFH09DRAFT_1086134 [Mycena vulgaris]|nr:hypothetical protein DFH09DRAFT_1086134 [Mycena vulgaris]
MVNAIDAGYTALVNISKEIDKLLAETQCNIQATSEAAARLVGHRATTIRQAKEIAELRVALGISEFPEKTEPGDSPEKTAKDGKLKRKRSIQDPPLLEAKVLPAREKIHKTQISRPFVADTVPALSVERRASTRKNRASKKLKPFLAPLSFKTTKFGRQSEPNTRSKVSQTIARSNSLSHTSSLTRTRPLTDPLLNSPNNSLENAERTHVQHSQTWLFIPGPSHLQPASLLGTLEERAAPRESCLARTRSSSSTASQLAARYTLELEIRRTHPANMNARPKAPFRAKRAASQRTISVCATSSKTADILKSARTLAEQQKEYFDVLSERLEDARKSRDGSADAKSSMEDDGRAEEAVSKKNLKIIEGLHAELEAQLGSESYGKLLQSRPSLGKTAPTLPAAMKGVQGAAIREYIRHNITGGSGAPAARGETLLKTTRKIRGGGGYDDEIPNPNEIGSG